MTDNNTSQAYFITGTDTEIGKTWASLHLIEYFKSQGKKVAAMKPVASGAAPFNEDALALIEHCNVELDYELVNPYCFSEAIAPHIAAEHEQVSIDLQYIKNCFTQLTRIADVVIVEGVGGWEVPLSNDQSLVDLVELLNIPVICVVGMRLGCINHALLTVKMIEQSSCELAGWIANTVNKEMLVYNENLNTLKLRINKPLLNSIPSSSSLQKINFHL